ncbi:MAG: hypothetical protein OWS74_02280, partial [Firmicutes bacterium]|nr:hypothetical protein [Bacillota bacterium]
RASAISTLAESTTSTLNVPSVSPSSGDEVRDQLNRLKSSTAVSQELAQLKAEMAKPIPPASPDGGAS